LVTRVLKVEFKGGKTHISKLAYKCMRHENMKSIGIIKDIDPSETITIVLKLKRILILLNLAVSKFWNNFEIFHKYLFFPLFPMMFGIVKPDQTERLLEKFPKLRFLLKFKNCTTLV